MTVSLLCPKQSNFLPENIKVIPTITAPRARDFLNANLLPRIKESRRCKMGGGVGVQRERGRTCREYSGPEREEWRHFVMLFCFYTESANRRSRRIADQVWRNIYSFPAPWVTDAFQWPPAPMTCAQSINYLLSRLRSLNAENITSSHRVQL